MFHTSLAGSITIGLISLVVLIYTAEKAVKKILLLTKHYGLSATFAGLTIFSVVTSFPEIFSHVAASIGILANTLNYEIASATVLVANIGSDVVQQTFVLGLIVLLMGGFVFKRSFLLTAYLPMIGTTLMCIILGLDRSYSRLDGLILFGTFFVYMAFLYKREKNIRLISKKQYAKPSVGKDALIAFLCMIGMLVSAHFLLSAAQRVVQITGLGGSLIGVLTLGIASATPEFFTAISGLRQKALGLSLGTLIGSNITNPLVAIGGGALISTYWVPRPLIHWDLAMETITASLLLIYLLFNKGKLGRRGAYYLIGLYIFYITVRITYFSVD